MMNRKIAAGVVALLGTASAFADTAFTTAVTTVSGEIAGYGGALVGVAAVGVGFMVAIKFVKKIRGAA